MEDPKTRTLYEGRIEISSEDSNRVIISFLPYLGTRYENLLLISSIELRFRYRPSYIYKKIELGLINEVVVRFTGFLYLKSEDLNT
jgi:hypothetical protein